jgi:single-stranded DNA-specific DHH superfamily exonuclease
MAIVSKYHKPCMIGRVNSRGEVAGSIRSDGNFAGLPSFKKFLEDSSLMTFTAGHDNAAGWGIQGNKIEALLNYANTHLKAEDFENCYLVDYILDGSDYNEDLIEALASHPEYFGNHVEEIKVVIENIPLNNIMQMGANRDSMKISYNNIDYVRFKDSNFCEEIMKNRMKKLTVYGRCNLNTFNGYTGV